MSSPTTVPTELNPIPVETTRRIPVDRWILGGIAIAVFTVIAGIASTGVSMRYFLQPTAAWIVLGGTCGVTLITTPRKALVHAVQRALGLLRQPATDREELMNEIVSCVRIARLRGLLAVEPRIKEINNAFLREMLGLAIDVKTRGEFQSTLETKLRLHERQGDTDAKVLEVAGGFAPAIGVIGTVVGLIDVLRQFSNMNSVAFGIGTAFVSTMYGLALANLILLPASHRIRASVAEAFEIEEMIIEGGLCLIDGTHPSLVHDRLNCFLREAPNK
ncbi:MAG: MotA/TolQ/ExbB proton channel family protein [Acidobacteriota bacterium]|nr:MotA/TolQ/ExbB proton channel family protein [Acidobacteriota bacterium]